MHVLLNYMQEMKYNLTVIPERRKDKHKNLITENVPLFVDIRFSGDRIYYFTGYRIDVAKFNPESQEMIKNTSGKEGKKDIQYNLINGRLTQIKSKLIELFNGMPDKKTIIKELDIVCRKQKKESPEQLEFFPMFEKYATDAPLSISKKKHVVSTLNHWKNFNGKLTFAKFDVDTLKAFERFLLTDKKKARGINTVHSILKITRAFWNDCRDKFREKKQILHYPFDNYKIPPEIYSKPIYITREERDILFNLKISNEKLTKVRDIFVFQCLIGARVGDLCKLTKANINNGVLSYIPRKTKDDQPVVVTVPLSPKVKEILSRYDLPDGRLMPFISDQRYNDYLKELFNIAGLTRIVTRMNPTTRDEEQKRLCDIASSHMARRAFIGNLYGKVDSGIISSMSGHVQGSKAFTRYYDVSPELQKKAIRKLDK